MVKKPKSSEGVSIDKNATYQPSAGYQPDWNAMHYDVKRPTTAKDWSKRPDPSAKLKPTPKTSRDRDRSR